MNKYSDTQQAEFKQSNHPTRLDNQTNEYSKPQWKGTQIEGFCSKKLWSILTQLDTKDNDARNDIRTAIKAELSARGEQANLIGWPAPH